MIRPGRRRHEDIVAGIAIEAVAAVTPSIVCLAARECGSSRRFRRGDRRRCRRRCFRYPASLIVSPRRIVGDLVEGLR